MYNTKFILSLFPYRVIYHIWLSSLFHYAVLYLILLLLPLLLIWEGRAGEVWGSTNKWRSSPSSDIPVTLSRSSVDVHLHQYVCMWVCHWVNHSHTRLTEQRLRTLYLGRANFHLCGYDVRFSVAQMSCVICGADWVSRGKKYGAVLKRSWICNFSAAVNGCNLIVRRLWIVYKRRNVAVALTHSELTTVNGSVKF